MHFEDFTVGQRSTAPCGTVTEEDLATFGDLLGQVLARRHAPPGEVTGAQWRRHGGLRAGDTPRCEVTTTRCARSGEAALVTAHVALRTSTLVEEGSLTVAVPARTTDPVRPGRAFGTLGWAEALADRLGADQAFTAATATWDGTLGLRCGDAEVHLRIYRGRIVDVTRRTPHGATFTVGASELTWTDLVTGPDGDFLRAAMRGAFEVTGSGYEYLRLTKVLDLVVGHARALARDEEDR